MSDLLEKRTIQERLIIVKTLLETVLDDLPSELSNNSKELENKNGELISRQFEEIIVEYPEITNKEHKGKPYYSIKYIENGKDKIIGFGTYKIEVLSRYIRDYFIPSADLSDYCDKLWKLAYERGKAEAQPRKGKWIFIHPLQADDEGAYICSNCHRGDWDIKPTDKYCKFCMADMREGEQDE